MSTQKKTLDVSHVRDIKTEIYHLLYLAEIVLLKPEATMRAFHSFIQQSFF